VTDGNKDTGNKRRKSKFYEMNKIMNDKPSISLPLVLDTSAVNKEQNDDIIDKVPETDYEDETAFVNEEDSTTTAAAKSETADEDVKPKVSTKRKRNVKVNKMEEVIDKMCEKLSSQQSESDQIFAELEEKCMKFKYDMIKMQ